MNCGLCVCGVGGVSDNVVGKTMSLSYARRQFESAETQFLLFKPIVKQTHRQHQRPATANNIHFQYFYMRKYNIVLDTLFIRRSRAANFTFSRKKIKIKIKTKIQRKWKWKKKKKIRKTITMNAQPSSSARPLLLKIDRKENVLVLRKLYSLTTTARGLHCNTCMTTHFAIGGCVVRKEQNDNFVLSWFLWFFVFGGGRMHCSIDRHNVCVILEDDDLLSRGRWFISCGTRWFGFEFVSRLVPLMMKWRIMCCDGIVHKTNDDNNGVDLMRIRQNCQLNNSTHEHPDGVCS